MLTHLNVSASVLPMKKITLSAVATAMLVLSACSPANTASDKPSKTETVTAVPAPTETVTETATPDVQVDSESLLLEAVYGEYPEMRGQMADSDITDLAESACGAFDNGASMDEVADVVLVSAGGDQETAEFLGFVVGAGTAALCPEYNDLVQDYVDRVGGSNL